MNYEGTRWRFHDEVIYTIEEWDEYNNNIVWSWDCGNRKRYSRSYSMKLFKVCEPQATRITTFGIPFQIKKHKII